MTPQSPSPTLRSETATTGDRLLRRSEALVGGMVVSAADLRLSPFRPSNQRALSAARQSGVAPTCGCTPQALRLVVRQLDRGLIAACWPGEIDQHDPACAFRGEPTAVEMRGTPQIPPTGNLSPASTRGAAREHGPAPDQGRGAGLGKNNGAARTQSISRGTASLEGIQTPGRTQPIRTRASTPQRIEQDTVLRLRQMLETVWSVSRLSEWKPGWRRDWSIAHRQIRMATEAIEVDGLKLARATYCPPPWDQDQAGQIRADWDAFKDFLVREGRGGFVIGCIRSIAVGDHGAVIRLRHHGQSFEIARPQMEALASLSPAEWSEAQQFGAPAGASIEPIETAALLWIAPSAAGPTSDGSPRGAASAVKGARESLRAAGLAVLGLNDHLIPSTGDLEMRMVRSLLGSEIRFKSVPGDMRRLPNRYLMSCNGEQIMLCAQHPVMRQDPSIERQLAEIAQRYGHRLVVWSGKKALSDWIKPATGNVRQLPFNHLKVTPRHPSED